MAPNQSDPSLEIDLDRGVSKRVAPTGMHVFMYKDDPGVFLDWNCKPISNELAKLAGFDVAKLCRDKERRDKIKAATEEIDKQYVERHEAYVVGDMQVIKGESSGYRIADMDGGYLSDNDVPFDTAKRILDEMSSSKSAAKNGKNKKST